MRETWVCEDYRWLINMWGSVSDTWWSKRDHSSRLRFEKEWEILNRAKELMVQDGDIKSEEMWNISRPNSWICLCA